MEEVKKGISRRNFLFTAGGVTIGISGYYLFSGISGSKSNVDWNEIESRQIDAWVKITSDERVIIYTPAAEMGQGSITSVPGRVAEEMDADWDKVTVLSSPVDAEVYGVGWYPGGRKNMTTAGSRTVRSYYQPMREAGAKIRRTLLQNAANIWKVNVDELVTEPGKVVHGASGRKMSYGKIADFKDFQNLTNSSDLQLKEPKDFRLIGKIIPRSDIPKKTDGSAIYGIDIQLPGMKYGFINRSPVNGARPELTNEEEVKNIDGVEELVNLDHGIGVVTTSIESGLEAKKKMRINWTSSKASSHNSGMDLEKYTSTEASEIDKVGDPVTALGKSQTVLESEFSNSYVYHAQMEPLNAVVALSEDKSSAELWIGSQAPDAAQNAVADTLELDPKAIKVNQLYLGGGFGRRTLPGYAAECASLAKAVNSPVKLIWTREDDVGYGAFRPQVRHFLKSGLDRSGKIVSWSHTAVGPGDGLSAGGAEIDYYKIPNRQFHRKNVDHGIRTKHWRGVGHGPNKFAVEAFIDQIARSQGKDPFIFRLEMMENDRARRVLERAAEIANWNPVPIGDQGMGIALADRDSFSCGIAQISLNRQTGVIRVLKYWCVVDAGVVVQPDNAVAQVEGAVMMGISSSLKERIEFKNGVVEQSNFHDYPILRMSEAPKSIEVEFVDSDHPPEGIGEAGIPSVGPAIASAFASITGKHLRDMPFTPERVLEVLKS